MAEQIGIDIVLDSTKAKAGIDSVSSSVDRLGKLAAWGYAAKQISDIGIAAIKTADEFTALEGRLADTMQGFGGVESAIRSINQISSETGASIQTVGKLFENVAESAKNAGKSNEDAKKLVETLSRIKTAYNIDNTGFSNAMLQLNQALSAGVLRGEEFNSVMENASPVMRALAKSLGVNVGHMRQLAEEGALTSDKIFQLSSQLPAMIEKMNNAPKTISTEWGKLVSQIDQSLISLNKFTGMSEKIAQFIGVLSNGIRRTREGSTDIIKIPRTKEQIGAAIDASGGVNSRSKLTREQIIENIYRSEQEEFEKKRSAGAAEFEKLLPGMQKEKELEEASKIEREKQKIIEEANFKKLKAGISSIKSSRKSGLKKITDSGISLQEQADDFEASYQGILAQRREAEKQEKIRQLEEEKNAELQVHSRYSDALNLVYETNGKRLDEMDQNQKRITISRTKNMGLQILAEAGQYSKKMFELSKAASLADAIVQGYGAVQKAWNSAPYPLNAVFAGIVGAQTAIQIRGIRAQKFNGSGSYSPGSTSGGGSSAPTFGSISEKFGTGTNSNESRTQKTININIPENNFFSANSVRELLKSINEELGNNVSLNFGG
jgi:tape measure domain-containing protein